jgi:hypothetical protein
MKVFISWSGPTSKHVATALRDLVTNSLPNAETWTSLHDITAGESWSAKLWSGLAHTDVGVLCVTSYNVLAPWLLFEAGTLAHGSEETRVIPYLYGVEAAHIPLPLSLFQGVTSDHAGTFELLLRINDAGSEPIPHSKLRSRFDKSYPAFEASLQQLWNMTWDEEKVTAEKMFLPEILHAVKSVQSTVADFLRPIDGIPIPRFFEIIKELEDAEPDSVTARLEDARAAADADTPGATAAQRWLDVAESWLASGRSRHRQRG